MRVKPSSSLGGAVPIFGRAHAVSRHFEQHRDVGETLRLLADARAARRSATARPSAALRVARSDSKNAFWYVMRETVVQRERAVRRLELADEAHERVLPLQPVEP